MDQSKRNLSSRARAAFISVGGLIAAVGIAWADGGYNWESAFDVYSTIQYQFKTFDPSDGNYTSVEAIRGPLTAGTFAVTPRIETNRGDLLSARFLVANDGNGDNLITPGEWSVVSVATVSTSGGVTIATFPTSVVSAFMGAYRIEHTWTGGFVSSDDILDTGLTAVDAPFALVYAPASEVGTVGSPISAMVPDWAGGAATFYSTSPALPAGLSINSLTGRISGTPLAPMPETTYVVTASNSAGSTTAGVTITVNGP